MSRHADDEHKTKMAAESAHATDDYEADEFEPAPEEHKDSPDADAAVASPYESEPFASASDEEEEVFSTPDAHLPPKGLELLQHRSAAMSDAASAAPRRPAATAASATSSTAAPARKSSLPSLSSGGSSLGGLPSIGLMSTNLTAAGRAHFTNQPTSLFAKLSHSNAAASMAAASVSSASDSSISPAALSAYAASNHRLMQAEYLGIHALQVAPCTSVGEVPPASSGAIVELDSGRLRIWCGAMEQPDLGSAAGTNGAEAAGFKLPSGVFLRAALTTAADNATPPLHISVDNSDPLSSPAGSADASCCVDAEGVPSAEVPSCFHAHRLGSYRLRIVARGSSMPSAPDSFTQFVTRAAAQSSETIADGTAAAAEQSPFDIAPRLTLYVAVEKLAEGVSSAAVSSNDAASSLPLLPVGASHTFWLSTHQSSRAAGASHSGSQTVLLFADPTDPSNDHLELTLSVQPLHADILKQITLSEPEMDEQDAEPQDTGAEAASASSAASTRKGKKKQKANAKKRSKNRQTDSETPLPTLIDVKIAAAAAPAAASSSLETAPLVTLTIQPFAPSFPSSAALSLAGPNGAAAVHPSLIDLLATLVVSPSQSLPTSILAAGQSVAQVAQLTSQVSRSSTAVSVSAAASNPSLPSVGASSTASATAVPSSGVLDPLLSSLDRRVHWPFSVSIDAIRVSDECEGHASISDSLSLDRLHNRTIHKPRSSAHKPKSAADPESLLTFLAGDHEIALLRTVGLLCAWSGPRDGSTLNRPVLVSQQPLLSYHLQCRLTRLDADDANARALDAVLDL